MFLSCGCLLSWGCLLCALGTWISAWMMASFQRCASMEKQTHQNQKMGGTAPLLSLPLPLHSWPVPSSWRRQARLPIPVFRNLFFGPKKPFLTGFLRISFFSCVFRRNFSQECVFGGVTGIPVFFRFYRNFSQEFLWAGIPVFTQDSGGFRRIPEDSCSRRKLSGSGHPCQRLKKALC